MGRMRLVMLLAMSVPEQSTHQAGFPETAVFAHPVVKVLSVKLRPVPINQSQGPVGRTTKQPADPHPLNRKSITVLPHYLKGPKTVQEGQLILMVSGQLQP